MNIPLSRITLYFLIGFIFLCLLINNKIEAQNFTLSGYVKDAGSGEALPSATISLPRKKTGTRSNDFGFYSITQPKDSIYLQIRYVGYRPIDTIVNLDKNLKIDFRLEEESTQLEEIIITEDAGKQTVQSSQMSLISLPMSRIKQIPVMFG